MQIQGEIRSAKVSKKIDDNNREIMVVDFRIKIPMGVKTPVRELLDLTGLNAIVNVEKAQLSIES